MILAVVGVAACARASGPDGSPAPAAGSGGAVADAPAARPVAVAPPPPRADPLTVARMEEVQRIVQEGAAPSRLSRVVAEYTGEPASLVARRTALAALRTERDRSVRLAALLAAARAPGANPDDDPLWPDLVEALAETWAPGNTAGGRRRMLREKDPRMRLLLVSSLAVYAGSNRGLSDMTIPQRRALRGELMSLYPKLPPRPRQQIDAFTARINVNARGTL